MKIANDKVVKIHFTVMDDEKTVIDTTLEDQPLEYIHGSGLLIEALENEITGHQANDTFVLDLPANQAYGSRQDSLVQTMPISMFEGMDVEPGMQFRATADEGDQSVIVIEVSDEHVVVDGNHPLAGINLSFDVQVIDVRDATEEELDHGHAHVHGHSCGEAH
jgi:FKBP-type peptidyl-prolyl cis-trans isomerase SlyD